MGTYATNSDVSARIPGRPLTASSDPTTTQVDAWIAEAEAMLTGVLSAQGISVPITDGGAIIMRSWVCDYAEGMTRLAHASASGDASNTDGQTQLDRFYATIEAIMKDASAYAAMLLGKSSSGTSSVRGYALGLTDEEAEPRFDGNEEW